MNSLQRKIKQTLGILLFAVFTWSCNSQENAQLVTAVDGKTIPSSVLSTKIDSIVKHIDMPGLSIAIVNHAEVVYYHSVGTINKETNEPVDSQTIFEGASLSKPIFAYFAMKMVEKGILDLDRPLYQYLPHPGIAEASKEAYQLITARMVLSHSTGFPNHSMGKDIELAFTPGTDFLYSGEGFQYLAAVIGTLNGMGFKKDLNNLFQQEVTEPLQMQHSTFVWDDYLAKHKAFGHDAEGNPTQNNPSYGGWSGNTFNAYSSLHSEAREYAQFLVALLQQKGLNKETFTEMFTQHTQLKDDHPLKQEIGQTGWGLGMAQKPTAYGMMHMHTGNNHDFQSYMMVLPEKKFGIVFFTNSNKAIPFIQGLNAVMGPVF